MQSTGAATDSGDAGSRPASTRARRGRVAPAVPEIALGGVPSPATGQDDRRHDQPEVHPVFRKKTHGQIIGEELHEGLAHIGTAVAEAGRAAAEQPLLARQLPSW